MKGKSHPQNDRSLNLTANESILDVIDRVNASRRRFVQTGIGASALTAAGGLTLGGFVGAVQAAPVPPGLGFPGFGFANVPASLAPVADLVTVPAGYSAQLMVAWGDPIMPGGVPFSGNATETAAQQMMSYGAHTDGMHFFPFSTGGRPSSDRGVLCANNEYTHEEILHPDGLVGATGYTIDKCRKSQAAHGVSIAELRRLSGKWSVVKSSPLGRRLTANTPMAVSGPAAGHALMKTVEFNITATGSTATGNTSNGRTCNGTANNCAHGITPWGTYLTCEENWNGYFGTVGDLPATGDTRKLYDRYGVTKDGFGYRWHTVDPRWDVSANPNEPNLFGWVVEIDPFNPGSMPVKRTALGRFKHESAQYVVDKDNRLAFYLGDDERNEYIYKFVCAGKFNPTNRAANRNLLDSGVLYVARFDSNLSGQWIALLPGTLGVDGVALRANPNFAGADDAEVLAKILIKTRMAADAVGATMMDRPEWTGARPRIGGFDRDRGLLHADQQQPPRRHHRVNNPDGSTAAGSARPPVDAANPRANNLYGHIIRWRETGKSVAATTFGWDLFVQNGDTATTKAPLPTNDFKGNIVDDPNGSADYGAPDGLWFDDFGRLWVQTDQAGDALGDWVNIGANSMVCADPNTGMTRRFLTGPRNCEVTGVTMTPDGKTMFVGIQHPGEDAAGRQPDAVLQLAAGPMDHRGRRRDEAARRTAALGRGRHHQERRRPDRQLKPRSPPSRNHHEEDLPHRAGADRQRLAAGTGCAGHRRRADCQPDADRLQRLRRLAHHRPRGAGRWRHLQRRCRHRTGRLHPRPGRQRCLGRGQGVRRRRLCRRAALPFRQRHQRGRRLRQPLQHRRAALRRGRDRLRPGRPGAGDPHGAGEHRLRQLQRRPVRRHHAQRRRHRRAVLQGRRCGARRLQPQRTDSRARHDGDAAGRAGSSRPADAPPQAAPLIQAAAFSAASCAGVPRLCQGPVSTRPASRSAAAASNSSGPNAARWPTGRCATRAGRSNATLA